MYNEHHRDDWQAEASSRFGELCESRPGPSRCIECGACEAVCPQKLPVIKYLKDVEKELG